MKSRAAIQLWKECRAIAPLTFAASGAMALLTVSRLRASLHMFGDVSNVWIYVLAVSATGALVVGHEFSGGTLASLLAQPVRRSDLGRTKLLALVLNLALLAVVARFSAFGPSRQLGDLEPYGLDIWLLPVVSACCLAPWLTLICRSALAGVVFTLAIPAILWIASGVMVTLVFGWSPDAPMAADAFRVGSVRASWLILCVAGAVAGWRAFLRLEARESGPLVRARDGAPNARPGEAWRPSVRSPLVNLFLKELRLQQMTFVLGGGYLVIATGIKWTVKTPLAPWVLGSITAAFAVLAAAMAGALAIAEDRQTGALDSQLLLPVATRWQSAVKFGAAALIAAGMGLGLPQLFLGAHDLRLDRLAPELAIVFLVSLYVSSLSQSGIKALLAAAAVGIALAVAAPAIETAASRLSAWISMPLFTATADAAYGQQRWFGIMAQAMLVSLSILAIAFAYTNFRRHDERRRRIMRQAAAALVVVVVAGLMNGVAEARFLVWAKAYREARMKDLTFNVGPIMSEVGIAGETYNGTTLDWSGLLRRFTWRSHTFFGNWFSTMGPVEEFTRVGYDDAAPGDMFVQIGIGAVRKRPAPDPDPFKPDEIVKPGAWSQQRRYESFVFMHVLDDTNGYAYRYIKTVQFAGDTMTIDHVLENHGRKPIVTSVTTRSVFRIDNETPGPGTVVGFPFDVSVSGDVQGIVEPRGRELAFVKALPAGKGVEADLKGFGQDPRDFDLRVEQRRTGVSVRLAGDRPIARLVLHAQPLAGTVSPDPTIDLRVEPGAQTRWKIVYTFYQTAKH